MGRILSGLVALLVIFSGACTRFTPKIEPKPVIVPVPAKGLLTQAAAIGDLESVKQLLRNGADINENLGNETEAVTPLLAAIAQERDEVAEFLILNGAAQHQSFRGYSAKDFASHRDRRGVSKLLDRGEQ